MAFLKFDGVGVRAISACVPKNVERITQLTNLFSREEMEKFTQTTGIKERRIISSESICVLRPLNVCWKRIRLTVILLICSFL